MSLLFVDGFDSYAVTADLPDKGWTNNDAVDATFESTAGRDGGGCVNLRDDFGGLGLIHRTFNLTTEVLRVAFWCNLDSASTITANVAILIIRDAAGTAAFALWLTAGGVFQLTEWDDGSIGGIVSGGPDIRDSAWHHVELHYLLGTFGLSDGTIEMWIDGSKVVDRVGDILNNFAATATFANTVDQLGLGPPGISSANIPAFLIDDLVVWDDVGTAFTGRLDQHRIETLRPTAEGNTIQFTPSTGTDNSALIDEVAANDADYVEDGTSTEKDTYVYGDTSFDPVTIAGVVVNTRAVNPDAGSISFKTVARSGTTEVDGTDVLLTGTAVLYQQLYEDDPDTAAAWIKTGVDAAEFGFKVV